MAAVMPKPSGLWPAYACRVGIARPLVAGPGYIPWGPCPAAVRAQEGIIVRQIQFLQKYGRSLYPP